MLMREMLGKAVSIRPEPTVTRDKIGTLEPGAAVTAMDIVDDVEHPGDPEYQWLKLPDATYVNYIHPPAGLRFDWLGAPKGPSFPFDLYRVKWDFQMYPYGFASRPAAFQHGFGEHWVLHTAQAGYGGLMKAAGKSLPEFLSNLPNFHSRVSMIFPNLQPPQFSCTDVTERSLNLHYRTHRAGLGPLRRRAAGAGHRHVVVGLTTATGSGCAGLRRSWSTSPSWGSRRVR